MMSKNNLITKTFSWNNYVETEKHKKHLLLGWTLNQERFKRLIFCFLNAFSNNMIGVWTPNKFDCIEQIEHPEVSYGI